MIDKKDFGMVLISISFCFGLLASKMADGQEVDVFEIREKIKSRIEWKEVEEEYQDRVTRWEPVTQIIKKVRKVKKPVYIIEEMDEPVQFMMEPVAPVQAAPVIEEPAVSVLEAPVIEVPVIEAPVVEVPVAPPVIELPVGVEVPDPCLNMETELVTMPDGRQGILSVPRVIRTMPNGRTVERRDNFMVDGFNGTIGQALGPLKGGTLMVGMVNQSARAEAPNTIVDAGQVLGGELDESDRDTQIERDGNRGLLGGGLIGGDGGGILRRIIGRRRE